MGIGWSAAVVAIVFCCAVPGHAQSTLSLADVKAFEGTWILDPTRSGLPDTDAERRVITTDPSSMRVEVHRTQDARPFSLTYKFDGSPTASPFGAGTALSKLSREAHGVVMETVFTVNDQPVTVQEVLPSQPAGTDLAIAVTVRVEHGYQGAPPAAGKTPPNVSKTTKFFRRQP